jgi:hypothetical protein
MKRFKWFSLLLLLVSSVAFAQSGPSSPKIIALHFDAHACQVFQPMLSPLGQTCQQYVEAVVFPGNQDTTTKFYLVTLVYRSPQGDVLVDTGIAKRNLGDVAMNCFFYHNDIAIVSVSALPVAINGPALVYEPGN